MLFPSSATIGLDAQYLNFSWGAEHGNFFFRNPVRTGTGRSDLYVTVHMLYCTGRLDVYFDCPPCLECPVYTKLQTASRHFKYRVGVDLTSQIGWSVMIAFNLASSLRGIVCLIYAELSNRKVNCLLQGN